MAGGTLSTTSGNSTDHHGECAAWYEWYPDYAYAFSGISLSAGNQITLTVTATSLTTASIVIDNLTTGISVTKTLTAPTTSAELCEANAEWVLEVLPTTTGGAIPDFGTLTITNALATENDGATVGPTGAKIEDIGGEVDVSTTATSITFTYV